MGAVLRRFPIPKAIRSAGLSWEAEVQVTKEGSILREGLLAEARDRVERFATSLDPAVVLDPAALAGLTALLQENADPASDVDLAYAAGMLHWCRYLARDDAAEADLAMALKLLEPVYRAEPSAVPGTVRALLEGGKSGSAAGQGIADQTAVLLQDALDQSDLASLDSAIETLRRSLRAIPASHIDRAAMLSNLALGLRTRYERTGSTPDLERAIVIARSAVEATSEGHRDRAGRVTNLGAALLLRFQRTGDLADLDAAIETCRAAVDLPPGELLDQAGALSNLGLVLLARFQRTGGLPDLDKAIAIGEKALDLMPAEHNEQASCLNNLGAAQLIRFGRTGDLADLNKAVAYAQQAVEVTAAGHPDLAARQANLCYALWTRSQRTGQRADLDAAILAGQAAIDATPEGHPDHAAVLANLSLALRARYEQTGEIADLDAAILAGQEAIDATPPGHDDLSARLSNRSVVLRSRFERTGGLADLDAAITSARQAVALTREGHPQRAERSSNLSVALRARFSRTGTTADLAAAIKAMEDAVGAVAPDHPDRAGMLSNLSLALRAEFERTGRPADLDKVITFAQEAVAATPDGHPRMATMQYSLGGALWARFEQTGRPEYADAAVTAAQRAVDVTLPGHPRLAGRLSSLSAVLRERFERTSAPQDMTAAIAAGRQAAAMREAAPATRAAAAREWGQAAATGGRWQEAAEAYEAAVDLLVKAAPRSLAWRDQEFLLDKVGAMASDAAASCVRAGLPDKAVELFEQGRGILLSQSLDTRTDLTALSRQHPGLAQEFITLRDELDRAGGFDGERPESALLELQRRRTVAEGFDQVIAEIRTKPGFGMFLRPLPVAALAGAAARGPVVIINVSRFGSAALILNRGGLLEPVPLPDLTPDHVSERTATFLAALDALPDAAAERRLADVLGWLWDAVAEPVLGRLGIAGPPPAGQPWPRLWWCVSGLLSFLPLHAAGHHDSRSAPEPQAVIDRVVSSYTPTIRALTNAMRIGMAPGQGAPTSKGDIMVVAMPRTPGAGNLPGAVAEADVLRQHFGERVLVLAGPDATRDAVLRRLPDAQWAHFACHSVADLTSPSASCLALADHITAPLTVTDIARLHMTEADLAFLSACSTARPGPRLPDEAIHLASAFQLAGYRHVIATLWPVRDRTAINVARYFYAVLANSGTSEDTAVILHNLTRKLRDQRLKAPSSWASHIHSGA